MTEQLSSQAGLGLGSVSAAVPVIRAASALREFHARLTRTLEDAVREWEIIYVDDSNDDGSRDLLEQFVHEDARVSAVLLEESVGLQRASFIGVACARHEVIVTLSGDLSHAPEDIPKLGKLLLDEDAACVYGVDPACGALSSRLFGLFHDKPRSLRISGFSMIRQSLASEIFSRNYPRVSLDAEILMTADTVVHIELDKPRSLRRSTSSGKMTVRSFWEIFAYYTPMARLFGRRPPGIPGWESARILQKSRSVSEINDFLS